MSQAYVAGSAIFRAGDIQKEIECIQELSSGEKSLLMLYRLSLEDFSQAPVADSMVVIAIVKNTIANIKLAVDGIVALRVAPNRKRAQAGNRKARVRKARGCGPNSKPAVSAKVDDEEEDDEEDDDDEKTQ